MFLSIDGIDGCGKSTQVGRLCRWLAARGREVVACRDPGSTALGEAIRELLLERHDLDIRGRAEMLLYMAARAQMVDEVIQPALAEGKTVVSDRYLLANVVYQGHGGGLDVETLWQVGRVATGGRMPELTVVLDLPVEQAATRLGQSLDRMERRGIEFQRRVREGFLVEARRHAERIVVVDARGTPDEVEAAVRAAVERLS